MNTLKIQFAFMSGAAAFLLFGLAGYETSFGQVEKEVPVMQPVDKSVDVLNGDTTSLLQQPHVRRDLELTQDQVNQLKEIRSRHDAMIKDVMTEYRHRARDMEASERSQFMRDLSAKRKQSQEEMETEVSQILLPFQLKRMEQIKVQNQLRRMGDNAGASVLHPLFRDKLNLSKEQEEKIQAKIQEVRTKLEQDIAKLRNKANEEVLEELTSEQRKVYDEIIGEPLKQTTQLEK